VKTETLDARAFIAAMDISVGIGGISREVHLHLVIEGEDWVDQLQAIKVVHLNGERIRLVPVEKEPK
jgi:hypothetical protein